LEETTLGLVGRAVARLRKITLRLKSFIVAIVVCVIVVCARLLLMVVDVESVLES
jgi:hypothetical protein